MLSVDDALSLLLSKALPIDEVEHVETASALGRVLAQPQISTLDIPPTATSAMDGYAIAHRDLHSGTETQLCVSQRIPAGSTGRPLEPHTVARIFTGAPLPAGADTVVMQEHCRAEGDMVIIPPGIKAGQNVRRTGEDITAGSEILAAGIQLRPQDMGLAASIGLARLPVYRKLRVAMLCTGDELTTPGTPLAPGKIYNANRYTLMGLLQSINCEIIDFGIVPDNLAATRTVLSAAAQQADVVVSSGGVSVGDEDHVKTAVEELGHIELWRIAMKPGKPLAFGAIGATPFFGLPGNPVSVFATFCLFARPFILRRQGMTDILPQTIAVQADFDWPKAGPRREYLRARLSSADDDAITRATLFHHQGSAALSSVSWAQGLVCIPEGKTVQRGQMVSFIPFAELLK
ncbi:MAG: molybdopterin molybdotransferase MoeA [Gammaproteobacteria bacterium]|nr:molybdopterin molybdotransferase MoeA [Gammaproteobacteria bacterium]